MNAPINEIIRAVGTIAVYRIAYGLRRPSRRAYRKACSIVTRYRAQAREVGEIVLNERGRGVLESILRVYRVVVAACPRIARVLAHWSRKARVSAAERLFFPSARAA